MATTTATVQAELTAIDRKRLTITNEHLRPMTPPSPSAWLSHSTSAKANPLDYYKRPAIRNVFMSPPVKTTSQSTVNHPTRPAACLSVSRPKRTSQSPRSSLYSMTSDTLAPSANSSAPSKGSVLPLTPSETPCRIKYPIQQASDILRVGEVIDPRYELEYYPAVSSPSSLASLTTSLDSYHSAQSDVTSLYIEDLCDSIHSTNDEELLIQDSNSFQQGSSDEETAELVANTEVSRFSSETSGSKPDKVVDDDLSVRRKVTSRMLRALSSDSRQIWLSKLEAHPLACLSKSSAHVPGAMRLKTHVRRLKLPRATVQRLVRFKTTANPSEMHIDVDSVAHSCSADNSSSVIDEADEAACACSDDYEGNCEDSSQQTDTTQESASPSASKTSLLRQARKRATSRIAASVLALDKMKPGIKVVRQGLEKVTVSARDMLATDSDILRKRAERARDSARNQINRFKSNVHDCASHPLKAVTASSSTLFIDMRARIALASRAEVSTTSGAHALSLVLRTHATSFRNRLGHNADRLHDSTKRTVLALAVKKRSSR